MASTNQYDAIVIGGGHNSECPRRAVVGSLFAALLLCSLRISAQEPAQPCDIPLVVRRIDIKSRELVMVNGLARENVEVQLDAVPAKVEGMSLDSSPKRIALILDASRNIPEDEWTLETEMASSLVENARPSDQFTFQVIGVPGTTVSSLSGREIKEQLGKLAVSRPPAANEQEKIYDALVAVASSLNPPQFGDAIFLFGHDMDFGSLATSGQTREPILKQRIRFFAMSFADPLAKLPPGTDLNKPLPEKLNFGMSELALLSAETGYFFSFHAVHNVKRPGQNDLVKSFLSDLYASIAEPYRLTIRTSAGRDPLELKVSVVNLKDPDIRLREIQYPKAIYPCFP